MATKEYETMNKIQRSYYKYKRKKVINEDNVCLFYLLLQQMQTKFVLIDVLFHVQCTDQPKYQKISLHHKIK